MNDQIFKIELTLNDLNIILAYLGKQPYEGVFRLIESIQQQAQKQAYPQNDLTSSDE